MGRKVKKINIFARIGIRQSIGRQICKWVIQSQKWVKLWDRHVQRSQHQRKVGMTYDEKGLWEIVKGQ
jgi:hypothetical protein